MAIRQPLCDLSLHLCDIFAVPPPPGGCSAGIWAQLGKEASRIHCAVTELPPAGPAPLAQLHALSQSTGRCLRLLGGADLRAPLVRHAMTILRAIIDGLMRALEDPRRPPDPA